MSLAACAAAAALVLSASCAERTTPMNDARLTGFATRYAEAWSSQDPAKLASFYADNGALIVNDGEPSVGRAAITETARAFMTAFPDMLVVTDKVVPKGDIVEFHWIWTGTNTGPGGTGKAVRMVGYEEWTIDESGFIVQSKGHYDEAEYQRQLREGAPPAEGGSGSGSF
jgi:uncharacterized protein (TIGR02246 family)